MPLIFFRKFYRVPSECCEFIIFFNFGFNGKQDTCVIPCVRSESIKLQLPKNYKRVTNRIVKTHPMEAGVLGHALTTKGAVFSSGFAPCIGVVMMMQAGGFLLHHAMTPLPGPFLDGCLNVIKREKLKVEAVYVFQKTEGKESLIHQHLEKGAIFVRTLNESLEGTLPPAIIVDSLGYTGIVADASKGIVFVVNKCEFISEGDVPEVKILGQSETVNLRPFVRPKLELSMLSTSDRKRSVLSLEEKK